MSKLGTPEGKEGPKSSIKNKIFAGIIAVLGGLGGADCATSVPRVFHPGGGRVTFWIGRVEACSENPNYIEQFRHNCRKETIRVFKDGGEICLRCKSK